jgi:hypothetical protein
MVSHNSNGIDGSSGSGQFTEWTLNVRCMFTEYTLNVH